jgi:hypothetical protein
MNDHASVSAGEPVQLEFFLVGSAADGTAHFVDPLGNFRAEVARAWNLPLGNRVRVDLRDCQFAWLEGRLELARSPDLPLNPRDPLSLRIGATEFTSRQVNAWSLL